MHLRTTAALSAVLLAAFSTLTACSKESSPVSSSRTTGATPGSTAPGSPAPAAAGAGSGKAGGGATAAAPSAKAGDGGAGAAAALPKGDSTTVRKGAPPKPDKGTEATYIASLTAIDSDIVHGKPDTAVIRGRNQCTSIKDSDGGKSAKDKAALVTLTNKRFTSPKHPDGFGEPKARAILDATHKILCPKF
ncbi:hypothetical protein ABT160_15830 [Streptomyces sp. NPDC001941]|uniref:hypothetical protein n=1 Tax=Streptomyces sp. NPDC001941 TaxID=3154659 RepID=UPI0033269F83